MSYSNDVFLEYKKRPGRPALARLLERHQDAVYSLCHQVLRHPQDAEDACQEVLLEVSRQLDGIEDPGRFAGWLYQTTLHTALDLKRRRERQRARDAGAGLARQEVATSLEFEELHRKLAGLDDSSRQLVVDHYFAHRPLRELAAERGCSRVAVWKKLQNARRRLRKELGSAALSAFEQASSVRPPADLLRQVLRLQGGLAMTTSSAIKVAIVMPLVLLAGAGILIRARRPDTTEIDVSARKGTSTPRPTTARPDGSEPDRLQGPTSSPLDSALAEAAAPRRPYPLKVPPNKEMTQLAARTHKRLMTHMVTLDETEVPLAKLLHRLADEAGISITLHPELPEGKTLTRKSPVIEPLGWCLSGMLGTTGCGTVTLPNGTVLARACGYEILEDGTVLIAPEDRLPGHEGPELRKVRETLSELGSIREQLDEGWDGFQDPDVAQRAKTHAMKIPVPQGECCLREELRRLREELGVYIRVDIPEKTREGSPEEPSLLERPFPRLFGEPSLGEHLGYLARQNGLAWVDTGEEGLCLTDEQRAREYGKKEGARNRRYESGREVLANPSPETGTIFVQDLLDSLSRNSIVCIIPSEDVWESGAVVSVPPEATLRDALDALKSQGFRWAFRDGSVFVIR
jgi:RNA polymerase sigma factor (sigma-70 family)